MNKEEKREYMKKWRELCGNCNKGIGGLKDDIKTIKKALKYLIKHKE